jgi:hypothetical protein|tara:strand:+ start:2678 stop:3298 length:621 start_codon:yes stop_codon:yes gene_type:complete
MIISHKHKFIFIHIPKCAGTSIRHTLIQELYNIDCRDLNQNIAQVFNALSNSTDMKQHSTVCEVTEYLSGRSLDINDYFTFAFTRNPWSLAVSYYLYANKIKETAWADGAWAKEVMSKTFGEFAQSEQLIQSNFIVPGVDFVGKIENLQEDFDIVCDRIGMNRVKLSHINKTRHKHYTEYYDDQSQDSIAQRCEEDIEKFNYKFGE